MRKSEYTKKSSNKRWDDVGEYGRYDGSEIFPATFYKMTLK